MKTYSNQSPVKVNITRAEVVSICRRFHVAPFHYRCFWRLAKEGQLTSKLFGDCLYECGNYRRACAALMHAMGPNRV